MPPLSIVAEEWLCTLVNIAHNDSMKHVTYHTFPHTFGTLLNANGESPKLVQELLRHASSKVTTDVYMQAVGLQTRCAVHSAMFSKAGLLMKGRTDDRYLLRIVFLGAGLGVCLRANEAHRTAQASGWSGNYHC
jgi:hypothetical protein